MSDKHYVKITPPKNIHEPRINLANGTVVTVGGIEVSGITEINLTASVDDFWRAEIHCIANVDQVNALAEFITPKKTIFQRIKDFLSPEKYVDVTSLDSSSRQFKGNG